MLKQKEEAERPKCKASLSRAQAAASADLAAGVV